MRWPAAAPCPRPTARAHLEEAVSGVGQRVADSCHRANGVGAAAGKQGRAGARKLGHISPPRVRGLASPSGAYAGHGRGHAGPVRPACHAEPHKALGNAPWPQVRLLAQEFERLRGKSRKTGRAGGSWWHAPSKCPHACAGSQRSAARPGSVPCRVSNLLHLSTRCSPLVAHAAWCRTCFFLASGYSAASVVPTCATLVALSST